MSQTFPQYYDGIVAGDPVYDLEAISFSELWGVKKIDEITPTPIQFTQKPRPNHFPAFPTADQQLFTTAILQACDGLDGTVDGVIDNLPACQAKSIRDICLHGHPSTPPVHRGQASNLFDCGANKRRQTDQPGAED